MRAVLRQKCGIRRHRRYEDQMARIFRRAVVQIIPHDPDDPKYESPDQTGWWKEYC